MYFMLVFLSGPEEQNHNRKKHLYLDKRLFCDKRISMSLLFGWANQKAFMYIRPFFSSIFL